MYFNSNSWWSKTKQFMIKWGEKKKKTPKGTFSNQPEKKKIHLSY